MHGGTGSVYTRSTAIILVGILLFYRWVPSNEPSVCGIACAAEPKASILAEFDFVPGNPRLTVPCEVTKKPYRFALATSESSTFSKVFAERLPRLPPDIDVPDDSVVAFRSSPQASIGPLFVRFPLPFAQCNLSVLGNRRFSQNDGIIGLDVLAQHILQVDFDDAKIRFLRSVPEAPEDRFEITSLQKNPRLCAVTVKAQCCGELAEEFQVELESPDTIYVRSPICRSLFEKRELRSVHQESTFDGTVAPRRCVATMTSFMLGSFRTKNARIVVHNCNVIGLGFLSRYVVTFDFPNGTMYLRPGKFFDRADEYDSSGLMVRVQNDSIEVDECEPGGPADEAGLKKGDLILDINGQRFNRNNQATFRKLLRQRGCTLRIHFQRDGDDQTVEMNLQSIPRRIFNHIELDPDSPMPDVIPQFKPRDPPGELPDFDEPDAPGQTARARL